MTNHPFLVILYSALALAEALVLSHLHLRFVQVQVSFSATKGGDSSFRLELLGNISAIKSIYC
jgi:hypothetical protein